MVAYECMEDILTTASNAVNDTDSAISIEAVLMMLDAYLNPDDQS